MTEKEKLILSICVLAVSIIIFIIVFVINKKSNKYRMEVLSNIEKETKDKYINLKLVDNKYFLFNDKVISGYRYSFKSQNEEDKLTGIKLKKHYKFVKDKVIYVINNNLHYPVVTEEIDGERYIELDGKIKTIEMLVTCEKPSHFMIKYSFYYHGGEVEMKIEEVKEDEHRGEQKE